MDKDANPKSHFSKLIAGVMNWGSWGHQLDTKSIEDLIHQCVEIGITSFDHEDIYGGDTTESDWGKAWNKSTLDREEIQIITKCGIMYPSENRPKINLKHYDLSTSHILNSVDTSLKNLQTDYIDLLLVHRPSPLMNPQEIYKAIDVLKENGKVKYFGVSNFTPSQIELLSTKLHITANQVEISPLELNSFFDGTLDQCIEKDIMPMAWSPMGGGKLFESLPSPNILAMKERMLRVALKYEWDFDEMIYLFLLHHPSGIRPVTGTAKIERLKTAVNASHTIISDSQWFEILEAIRGHEVA